MHIKSLFTYIYNMYKLLVYCPGYNNRRVDKHMHSAPTGEYGLLQGHNPINLHLNEQAKALVHPTQQRVSHTTSSNGANLIDHLCTYTVMVYFNRFPTHHPSPQALAPASYPFVRPQPLSIGANLSKTENSSSPITMRLVFLASLQLKNQKKTTLTIN